MDMKLFNVFIHLLIWCVAGRVKIVTSGIYTTLGAVARRVLAVFSLPALRNNYLKCMM